MKPASTAPALLLGEYTAIDLTGLKGQLCGRLLADLGMEVIKVEPPEGDPVRHFHPLWKGGGDEPSSLLFAHLNASKKSVVLDLREEEGRRRLASLVNRADVVVESFAPGFLDSLHLGYPALARNHPGLIMASITGFGQTGPRNRFFCPDIVAYAMGGLMSLAGSAALPPCKPPETQAYYFGSLMAALGIVAALYKRERTGRGDWIDVSMQEALATQEHLIRLYANEKKIIKRQGSQHAQIAPAKIFPCRDGYVYLYVSRRHWKKLLAVWPDHAKELDDPELIADPVRRDKAPFVNAQIESFTRRYGKEELTAFLQSHGIPCVPVNTPREFLADEHVRQRTLLTAAPSRGEIPLVAAPFLLNGLRPSVSPPPGLGEHQEELEKSAVMRSPANALPSAPVEPSAPLSGLRILSFDQVLAGPYGMTLLAAMGAEVIKIESRQGGLDLFRFVGASPDPDLSPRFLEFNRNKKSVTVNLKSREGVDLVKSLVRHCHAVMDNFSAHVMPSLKLDHSSLAQVNPEIVTLRMPGLGCTGPKSSYVTLGTNISALTGLTYLWNHPETLDPPIGSQTVWPDYVSGLLAATLLVAATLYQKRHARGTFVDLAQAEAAAYMIGASLTWSQLSGEDILPLGNGSFEAAPQGCYPCQGEDRWCVISIESDSQWRVFATLIGREDLGHNERFATLQGRLQHHRELDDLIAGWTQERDSHEVMNLLQQNGIPCGAVQNGADLVADEQLQARNFVLERENATLGPITLPGFPIRFAHSTIDSSSQFPVLGRDNGFVFGRILNLPPERIAELERQGVLA